MESMPIDSHTTVSNNFSFDLIHFNDKQKIHGENSQLDPHDKESKIIATFQSKIFFFFFAKDSKNRSLKKNSINSTSFPHSNHP